jgi:hypothetical protein
MKVYERDRKAPLESITLRAPLVGLAIPDPMLGYPEGTVLIPRVFIRNAGEDTVPVEVVLSWKSPTSPGRIPIKLTAFAPQETGAGS